MITDYDTRVTVDIWIGRRHMNDVKDGSWCICHVGEMKYVCDVYSEHERIEVAL